MCLPYSSSKTNPGLGEFSFSALALEKAQLRRSTAVVTPRVRAKEPLISRAILTRAAGCRPPSAPRPAHSPPLVSCLDGRCLPTGIWSNTRCLLRKKILKGVKSGRWGMPWKGSEGQGGVTTCASAEDRGGEDRPISTTRVERDSIHSLNKNHGSTRSFLFHASCDGILFGTKVWHAPRGQAKEFLPGVDYKNEELLLARLIRVVLLGLPPLVPVIDLFGWKFSKPRQENWVHPLSVEVMARKKGLGRESVRGTHLPREASNEAKDGPNHHLLHNRSLRESGGDSRGKKKVSFGSSRASAGGEGRGKRRARATECPRTPFVAPVSPPPSLSLSLSSLSKRSGEGKKKGSCPRGFARPRGGARRGSLARRSLRVVPPC